MVVVGEISKNAGRELDYDRKHRASHESVAHEACGTNPNAWHTPGRTTQPQRDRPDRGAQLALEALWKKKTISRPLLDTDLGRNSQELERSDRLVKPIVIIESANYDGGQYSRNY